MSPEPLGEETATGEGQPLAPCALREALSKVLPLTDRVALAAKEGRCETRSPLPQRKERWGRGGASGAVCGLLCSRCDRPGRDFFFHQRGRRDEVGLA
jgi:hypothetical protein